MTAVSPANHQSPMLEVKPNKRFFQDLTFPLKVVEQVSQENTALHAHEFVELVVILGGAGDHVTTGGTRHLSRGDVLIIPIQKAHRYENVNGLSLVNVVFYPQKLQFPRLDLCTLPGYDVIFHLSSPDAEAIPYPCIHLEEADMLLVEKQLRLLVEEFTERRLGFRTRALGIFLYLTGFLAPLFATTRIPRQDYHQPAIEKVVNYLEDHYDQNVTLAELVHVAAMSRSTLMREFSRLMGISPLQYLVNIRLEVACQLLRENLASVTHICYQVGFSSASYFSRCFLRRFHQTPSQYRKRLYG